MDRKVTIKIPRGPYQRIRKMIQGTGVASVTEFLAFVMRSPVSDAGAAGTDWLSAEEIRATRERLKRLGYLGEEE